MITPLALPGQPHLTLNSLKTSPACPYSQCFLRMEESTPGLRGLQGK